MKRDVATDALAAMLANVAAGGRFVELVESIYVFGSYARGALERGDIDVYVERGHAQWWGSYAATRLLAGKSSYSELRSALVGRSRRFQVQFEPLAASFWRTRC